MSDRAIEVLLVEDNPGDVRLIWEMLAEANTAQFGLSHAERLSTALELLVERSFDVVLLDLSLPDAHGLQAVAAIRSASPRVPIVVVSGLSDEETAIKSVQQGAQDYLVKGHVDGNLLARSIRYAIERKRADDERERLLCEVTELNRLKDQFISVAAHELKTPVAIMKGYAQALLRTGGDIPPPVRKMLEAIDRGADRIDRIIGDLLDISRLLAGRMELVVERIDLLQLIEEVVDRTAAGAGKHRLRVESNGPLIVRGDRDRLEQVLTNLLDNAVRYSPSGGDVTVRVDVCCPPALPFESVVVSVTDQGVGIAEEKHGHVFERFYRAHNGTPYDFGGMGVGLYISSEIVACHGGRVWFESKEGQGSTFYFSLPLREGLESG